FTERFIATIDTNTVVSFHTEMRGVPNQSFPAGTLLVRGQLDSGGITKKIYIYVPDNITAPHSFQLDQSNCSYNILVNNVPSVTYNGLFGECKVEYYNKIGGQISGTFNFVGTSASDTVAISNGDFGVKIFQ